MTSLIKLIGEAGPRSAAAVTPQRSIPRRWRGPGLRARLTLLATTLTSVVSALLLWLAWMLAGDVVSVVPQLPDGSTIEVNGVAVTPDQLSTAFADHARDLVLKAGAVAFLSVVVAAAILAWTLTGRLLRPLQEVTATARRLSAESLAERIALPGPRDEVAELADTFDAMLDRLQATFDSQRRFVANASHELRTPLSVIRTELDVTLADSHADAAELRRMATVIGNATMRAGQLVESLLLLARTEGAGLAGREPVDLAVLVSVAWQVVQADASARCLRSVFDTQPVQAIGDAALLERVAGNLVENAVRHNIENGWIEVHTHRDGRWAVLRVRSSGQVIEPGRVEELFEPFRRAGLARTAQSGAGLGLSIVRAVVAAHDGQLDAEAVPDGGLSVTVRLPAAP